MNTPQVLEGRSLYLGAMRGSHPVSSLSITSGGRNHVPHRFQGDDLPIHLTPARFRTSSAVKLLPLSHLARRPWLPIPGNIAQEAVIPLRKGRGDNPPGHNQVLREPLVQHLQHRCQSGRTSRGKIKNDASLTRDDHAQDVPPARNVLHQIQLRSLSPGSRWPRSPPDSPGEPGATMRRAAGAERR